MGKKVDLKFQNRPKKNPLDMTIEFSGAQGFRFKNGYIAPLKNSDYDFVIFLSGTEAIDVPEMEDEDDD